MVALPASLTESSNSGSTRLKNRRSSSVSRAPSPSLSADSNSFESIGNSPLLKRLSPPESPCVVPLSYFLSKSRTGRIEGSSDLNSIAGGTAVNNARRGCSSFIAASGLLNGSSSFGSMSSSLSRSNRYSELTAAASSSLLSVPSLSLSSRSNRASVRSTATRPI